MAIWKKGIDLATFPTSYQLAGAAGAMGIELVELGEDFLTGRMPVDHRTVQPMGILNGGASCVLGESLGSIAGNLVLQDPHNVAVGQNLHASHLRPAIKGHVWGTATARHIGRRSQVWEINIVDDNKKPVCLVILGLAVIAAPT